MKHQTKKAESENTNNLNRNKKLKSILLGIGIAAILYIIFGAVTAIIPNKFFTRMTPVELLEHSSLLITSILLGAYVGLLHYGKTTGKDKLCNASATTGGVFGFLTFGCSICNKILVFFLGITGVLAYFEPIRPILGFLSIGLLGFAVITKARSLSII